ncbi:MAG: hypothetical protein COW01_03810 [Bdellovibrionales bacterium CG12_big_fil_rev_8_21_14_0_65_38_15]|nr:MAG: hypothetical protein COW79_02675 [Bdellovibrionales bacterium CG22_combo_CG10-13_8_21_14_all_38_13]PIQ56742.1 MAG: hypothetical protein COW01_03810 [Bdellovibrionales bacterium CG12_big_fil_rev_8_21_14_0_65_38_15]PIR31030.1 MAG: hypothetical protein COV38_02490 [Bdellovibrionales bacterium CG11_big_fil_rev_8_21_14_0_20_38_13]
MRIFIALGFLGAVIPYLFFIDFFSSHGVDVFAFVDALFVNGAAGGFSADLLISSLSFWIFIYYTKWTRLWPFVTLNLLIGLSCALPIYFYFGLKKNKIL